MAALDLSVLDVAGSSVRRYTGGMTNHPDPSDIIPPTEAMRLMGIKSKATFYDVLKRIARQYGRDLRHKPHPLSRTSYYLRSEVLAYVRGEWDNPSDSGA